MALTLGRLQAALLALPLLVSTSLLGVVVSPAVGTPGGATAAPDQPRPPLDRAVPPMERPTDEVDREGPTYGDAEVARACGPDFCTYWVEEGPHAVAGDGDLTTMPALVRAGVDAAEEVLARFEGAGWRRPKPDGGFGGDDRFDLYFADLDAEDADGWCPTDDPSYGRQGRYDVWAFCVIDNDFDGAEQSEAVDYVAAVVAHEFFHAIQAAYDYGDDSWLGEATAMWAEATMTDEPEVSLYGVAEGPVGTPSVPMDKAVGLHHYGAWTFFRFLEERITDRTNDVADIVLEMWLRADSSAAAEHGDEYSMQAVERALAERDLDFAEVFAAYSNANRDTHRTYEGAAEWDWPSAPDGSFRTRRGWQVTRMDHLTSATYPATPVAGSEEAVVKVRMAPERRGSVALVTRYAVDGSVDTVRVTLNRKGRGSLRVPFVDGQHERVDVVLVNASTRFRDCGSRTRFSCGGIARDDGLTAKVKIVR